jgi:DNA-binding SARP family transcriptional activator/tetratricopeptide (TPR) repeat protein
MELRLLGPVEVWAGGRMVDAGSPRQRCVLAALAVDTGRPVSTATVVDRVWGDTPPDRVRNSLYVYITRLRTVIRRARPEGDVQLVRRAGGYLLDADPGLVDLVQFRRLLDRARGPACPDQERAALLDQALSLWRGTPLMDMPGEWAARISQSWRRHRLDAVVLWAQTRLRLGEADAVVGPLTDLVAEHPAAELLTEVLMRALCATGRPAEALDLYALTSKRLSEELGVDPGPGLQRLHLSILRGDGDQPVESAPPTRRYVPAQLPPDVRGFAGRETQLAQLDRLLATTGEQPTAVVISAVSGTAGVGKTTLAVHWGHRVAKEFPDGQLYVNLRGFDPSGSPMSPAEAVRGFLDALDVPARSIPLTLDGQIGLYRSQLAGRRMLVLLDNARDTEQVRPLLPARPGCVAVVTSRNQLPGLVAIEGAHSLSLDVLSTAEARQVLARRLGEHVVGADPGAVDEIVSRCSRLPLALAIVCARAATNPGSTLATLAIELRDAQGGLQASDGGDPAIDVRSVFSWSYRTLSPDAARLFRLLGLHPGPDLSAAAAASLAATPPAQVRPLLTELTRAHLLTEHSPGRYAFHDLLRAYAAELTRTVDSGTDRNDATRRILDHYLRTGYACAFLLQPDRDGIQLIPAQSGVTPETLAGQKRALDWFIAEHPVLLAAIDRAASTGFDTHAWQLSWTLTDYFDRQGHWRDWATTYRTTLQAARRSGERLGSALTHRELARAYARSANYEEALRHLRDADELFVEIDDQAGQARVHDGYAFIYARMGRNQEALRHAQRALALYRSTGNRLREASSLNNLGWAYAHLGDHRQAVVHARDALAIVRKHGGGNTTAANIWDTLGYAYHQLGRYDEAATSYQHAVDILKEFGDKYHEARGRHQLGDVHRDAGDLDAARDAWQRALQVLDELNHPEAGEVRQKLAALAGG